MNILKKTAVILIILTGTASFISGQTLKELIDQSKEIKVYFRNRDIVHKPNTSGNPESQRMGTNCFAFSETSPLPTEYIAVTKEIIGLLNTGFNTSAFVEGDISYLSSLPVNSDGELDWIRLGEPLTFFISSSGYYTVKNFPNTGKENTLEIESYLYVFSFSGGKLKTLASELLAWKQTDPIRTQKCDDYAWFIKNIPSNSLVEPFKISVKEKTLKFIEKEISSYNRSMRKKT